MIEIKDLIEQRAKALADHDGVPIAFIHRHAAADQLQHELRRERDLPQHRPAGRVFEVGQQLREGVVAEVSGNDVTVEKGAVRSVYPAENLAPAPSEPVPAAEAASGDDASDGVTQ